MSCLRLSEYCTWPPAGYLRNHGQSLYKLADHSQPHEIKVLDIISSKILYKKSFSQPKLQHERIDVGLTLSVLPSYASSASTVYFTAN